MAIKKLPTIEPKNRTYILKGKATPISYVLRGRNTQFNSLLYFDGVKNRALRYSPNQKSIFEDAQDDNVILKPIIFEDGKLTVNAQNAALQLFLKVHPQNGIKFEEFNPELDAQDEVEGLLSSNEAVSLAIEMDISDLEAIARVVKKGTGENVDKLTSSVLKRDMILFAANNPDEFIRFANDTDIKLRNLAVRAVDTGIVSLKDDNTVFYWGNTKKKVVTVPFGENPYTLLASYFKTDEGLDAMKAITEKLA